MGLLWDAHELFVYIGSPNHRILSYARRTDNIDHDIDFVSPMEIHIATRSYLAIHDGDDDAAKRPVRLQNITVQSVPLSRTFTRAFGLPSDAYVSVADHPNVLRRDIQAIKDSVFWFAITGMILILVALTSFGVAAYLLSREQPINNNSKKQTKKEPRASKAKSFKSTADDHVLNVRNSTATSRSSNSASRSSHADRSSNVLGSSSRRPRTSATFL